METTQYYCIQRLIINSLHKVLEEEVDRSVNQGPPARRAEMQYITFVTREY